MAKYLEVYLTASPNTLLKIFNITYKSEKSISNIERDIQIKFNMHECSIRIVEREINKICHPVKEVMNVM